jgi:hypothetical protein
MGISGKIKEALGLNGHDEREAGRKSAVTLAREAQREADMSRARREFLVMEIQYRRRLSGRGRD